MSKVLSTLDYWEEFFKKYPDKEPFIDFVSQDKSLLKIFNFTSEPDINLIKQYPFEDKIKQMQSISQKDIEHLYDLSIETGKDPEREKESHWLEYLVNLYELVGTTLRLYNMLKEDATLSQNQIIDFINIRFRRHLVLDKTFIIDENDGVQNVQRAIGRTDPFYKLIFTNNNMLLVQFDLHEPTKEEIKEIKNELDIKSVINFQRYRPIGPVFDKICFGGGRHSNKYQVEFYFKDKMLDKFSYPIHKRYEKLVDKGVKSLTMEKYEKDKEIAPWAFVYESLSKWSLSYDSSEGVRPAGYFKERFKRLKSEYYKKGATTSLPGDPRPMGKYPYCDGYCKNQKDHENQLPCEYETIEGYCKDPDKKKARLKFDIEHSGPEIDGIFEDENGYETSRHDQFDAGPKPFNPYEEIESKQDEVEIYKLCEDEMDMMIIYLLKGGRGRFEHSDKINYSAIADELDTYPNDIRRRYEEILKRAKKHPHLRNFLK